MKRIFKRVLFNLVGRALNIVPQKTPTLLSGVGNIKLVPSELEVLKAKNPLIVTDRPLMEIGIAAKLEEVLAAANVKYAVFGDVLPDPSFEVCSQGLAVLRDNHCDSVIAIGGGSVMDAGKLIRMGATHDKPMEKFAGLLRCHNNGLPFICIPTTAGTGSEATAAAVITDSKRHKKVTVLDPRLPPNTAILDPSLTLGLPPGMTASTGIDALTHAVEAYTNTLHFSDVDAQAVEAVRLIFLHLAAVYAKGRDISGREALLRASHLAGRAFTRGFVGYVHAIAHRFGERYHIPHGLANAIVLPYFLDVYEKECPERLATLARASGCCGSQGLGEDAVCAHRFVDAVRALNASVGIPEKAAFLVAADIPGIVADALKEAHGTPYPVPYVMDASELAIIVEKMLPPLRESE
jgi:alcohol dehydrogenase class IV